MVRLDFIMVYHKAIRKSEWLFSIRSASHTQSIVLGSVCIRRTSSVRRRRYVEPFLENLTEITAIAETEAEGDLGNG